MMNWINGSVCKIQEYFESTTIHGIQYILQPGRNILERLFWILASVFATYCTCRLLSASWTNFQTSAVSFVVDTAYLDWDTHFPAISLCEAESQDKLEDASTRIFGVNRNRDFDFFLRDIAYFDGKCDTCKLYEPSNNFPANISYIVSRTRSSCIEFMANCSWNGIKFDCCEYFLPLETELGICYSLNSMHVPRSINQLKFISNMDNPSGILNFDFLEYKAYLFIHPKEDVPFINHPTDEKTAITTFDNSDIIFKVRDIANDELLRAVSVGQRNCRFPNENYLQVYKYYSYSACVVNCRARAQINLCNCTHHFMPKIAGINTCNITGLICLSKYLVGLRRLLPEESAYLNVNQGLNCPCVSSCEESEYSIVSSTNTEADYNLKPVITVRLDSLPSMRFLRKVVRSRLDLVVIMGGSIGLFLGASLLSMVECIYFIFIRRRFR